MANTLYIVLGAIVCAVLYGIHSYEDIGTSNILVGEPSLEFGVRSTFALVIL